MKPKFAPTLLLIACLGCAAVQWQPFRSQPQQQAAAASQTAGDNAKVINTTRLDNRQIEGQPPAYTFWGGIADKLLIAALIALNLEQRLAMARYAKNGNGAH